MRSETKTRPILPTLFEFALVSMQTYCVWQVIMHDVPFEESVGVTLGPIHSFDVSKFVDLNIISAEAYRFGWVYHFRYENVRNDYEIHSKIQTNGAFNI